MFLLVFKTSDCSGFICLTPVHYLGFIHHIWMKCFIAWQMVRQYYIVTNLIQIAVYGLFSVFPTYKEVGMDITLVGRKTLCFFSQTIYYSFLDSLVTTTCFWVVMPFCCMPPNTLYKMHKSMDHSRMKKSKRTSWSSA